MTIKMRNWLFISGLIFLSILIAALSFLLIQWILTLPAFSLTTIVQSMTTGARTTVKGLAFAMTSFIVIVFLFLNFRRTASPEVFFYFIFMLTFPQEGILRLIYLISSLDVPIYYITIGYRVFFFLQLTGFFSLFAAGLFSNNIQYTKLEISLGIILLASLTLSAFIPIDSSVRNIHLFRFREVWYLLIGIKILAVVNFIIAAFRQGTFSYLWCAAGLSAIIIVRDLQYYTDDLPTELGLHLLFIAGSWLYLNRLHRIYRWL